MTPRTHEVVYGCLWYLYNYSEPLTKVIFHSYVAVYQRVSHMLLLKSVTGGIPTPLKNMTSSVGMMKFPTECGFFRELAGS